MSRIRRIITSFAIVLCAYWVYRFTAVPLIEPAAEARTTEATASNPPSDGQESVRRHEALLAKLYADGAWQRQDPIVLEGDHVMFVMKEWQNLDNGQVRLNPCTMIFFPSGDPNVDPTAVSRAIVLEAPQGALLQFDEALDIRRAKIGKLVGGHMPGNITVRGSTGPNGEDEIFAQTHDVQLSEDRIWTPHPVEFRIGPSYGSGREMQIHLLPAQGAGSRGPNIGGIESFELLYEVSMHLQPPAGGGMFPGDQPTAATRQQPATPQPPIDIACQGPFRFDLGSSVASFREQVNVVRPNPRGPQSDQLTCEKLSIFFQPRTDAAHASNAARSRGPERGMSNLEPRRLEADGLPVVVTSPSTGMYAKGQHLEYDIVLGTLKLVAEDEALLHQEANEARGRKISYQPLTPPRGGASAPVEGAEQNPPQISIVGAAQLRSTEYGQLTAEEIHVWLLDTSGQQQIEVPEQGGAQRTRFAPDRLLATGNVDIRTTAVSSPADKPIDTLEVWFKHMPLGQQLPLANTMAANLGADPASPQPAFQQPLGNPPPTGRRPAGQQPQQHYEVAGQRLQMQVLMQGRQTVVDRVTILGDVFFSESAPQSGERPLSVTGTQLQVENATTPDTKVTVVGSPAHVEAQGLTLVGAKIDLSRRDNRLWIDGPGQMTVPVDRDLQGHSLASARPMNITWREKMDFDGLTAHFAGQIEAKTEAQLMRTETMDVSLAKRLDFNEPPRGERPQVALLLCHSGVFVEGKSIEPEPPSVQRMQMGDLSIDLITGKVHANGPGRMTVVRLGRPPALDDPGRAGSPLGGQRAQAAAQATEASAATREPQLMYLNVTFRNEITGNINERQLTFHGQVDTLYGPIKTWEEQLNADRIEGLGPQGVHLQSDDLKVIDMSANGRNNREIEALGNVRAEGITFTARCASLRYSEGKDLITLSGDGRSPANLYRQEVVGGPKSQASAGKILYWPGTQRVEVDDARMLDIGQLQTTPSTPSAAAPAHHTPKKPLK